MEIGHSDNVIITELLKKGFPNVNESEIISMVSEARTVYQLTTSNKGIKRDVNQALLNRLKVYYENISKIPIDAHYANGYIYLQSTELGVLRLFHKLHQTLNKTSVGKKDGDWYFRFSRE